MVDHELRLVTPAAPLVEAMVLAAEHPASRAEPAHRRHSSREVLEETARNPHDWRYISTNLRVPAYTFWMALSRVSEAPWPTWGERPPPVPMAGSISLRISDDPETMWYYGHIGYGVFPPARGNRYAERACRLMLPLARLHGLSVLWITCNPDNLASRRTCERLGATLEEVVALPRDHALALRGETHKCRYRLEVSP